MNHVSNYSYGTTIKTDALLRHNYPDETNSHLKKEKVFSFNVTTVSHDITHLYLKCPAKVCYCQVPEVFIDIVN